MSPETRLGHGQPLRFLREGLLWAFAALGILCIVAAGSALAFGATPLIFRSGSMAPAIPTGSLAISVSTPANELRAGDVVSVVWADGTRVSHRRVSTKPAGNLVTLRTQGDANEIEDTEQVTVAKVDRIVWHVPQLGFFLQEAMKPQYVFAVGVIVGGLLILAFRSAARTPEARSGRRRAGSAAGGTLALVLVGGLVLAPVPTSTMASFSNQEVARSTLATGSVGSPSISSCTVSGLVVKSINLTWSHPSSGLAFTQYRVTVTGSGLLTPSSERTVPATATTVSITSGALGILDGIGSYTVRVIAELTTPVGAHWVKTSTNTATANTLLGVITGCTVV